MCRYKYMTVDSLHVNQRVVSRARDVSPPLFQSLSSVIQLSDQQQSLLHGGLRSNRRRRRHRRYKGFRSIAGDFGNENLELVRSIADLEFSKAVILGNHDAWSTRKFTDKKKDSVQLQLECLGGEHVGYRRLDFPLLKLSVVGGRPFSCGGERMFRKTLLTARYGVQNINGSAEKIFKAALGAPEEHSVILLAHNGPTGLGSNMNDICGRDWVRGGGDHGDPDLAHAISLLKEKTTHSIPLVVFGHMHKELAYGNDPRKMIVVGDDNTIYLNGAIVPRVIKMGDNQETCTSSSIKNETALQTLESEGTLRVFTVVDIVDGNLEKIAETWVSVIGEKTMVKEEHILFSSGPRVSELSLERCSFGQ